MQHVTRRTAATNVRAVFDVVDDQGADVEQLRHGQPMAEGARVAAYHVDAGQRRIGAPAFTATIRDFSDRLDERANELNRAHAIEVASRVGQRTVAPDHQLAELVRRGACGQKSRQATAHLLADGVEEGTGIREAEAFALDPTPSLHRLARERALDVDSALPEPGIGNHGQDLLVLERGVYLQLQARLRHLEQESSRVLDVRALTLPGSQRRQLR